MPKSELHWKAGQSMSGSSTTIRFARLENIAREKNPAWYHKGRNPWVDLYSNEVLDGLAKISGITDDTRLEKIAIALCEIAEKYDLLADEVALELTAKQRNEWVHANLVSPALRLSALSTE